LILSITFRIIFTKHDIHDYTVEANPLFLKAFIKPIYAWKYIALHGYKIKVYWIFVQRNAFFRLLYLLEMVQSISIGVIVTRSVEPNIIYASVLANKLMDYIYWERERH